EENGSEEKERSSSCEATALYKRCNGSPRGSVTRPRLSPPSSKTCHFPFFNGRHCGEEPLLLTRLLTDGNIFLPGRRIPHGVSRCNRQTGGNSPARPTRERTERR